MILTYTLDEKEYLEAQRAFKAHLARGRLFFRMTVPVALGAALVGAYSFLVAGNPDWGVGLCLASAYLLSSRIVWWKRRVRRALEENPEQLGPFEVELTQEGVRLRRGEAALSWPLLLRYFETRDLFLLQGPARELCILPKRAFPTGSMLQWTEKLRGELRGKGGRDNPDAFLLKLTATWAVVALFLMVMFVGSVHNFLAPGFRRAATPRRSRTPSRPVDQPARAVPVGELSGTGMVYLVPLGKPQSLLSADFFAYYRKKYHLELHVLAPLPIPEWTRDDSRQQLIAEELVEAMKRAYPQVANDPDDVLIGITDEDIYISDWDWRYAIRQNLPDGRTYTFHYFLDPGGPVVGVDVGDSAGLNWKISMSGGAQYTMQPVRNH